MTPESEGDEGDDGHGVETLEAAARRILQAAWRDEAPGRGFCVPNPSTYPWQWLWDSCFHAVVWGHLGDERGLVEVRTALADMDADGFVPHVRYASGPTPHRGFWGRPATSSITQPPMFGHALAELHRLGFQPDDALLERAAAALRFLLRRRRRSPGGLVELCHPWESGCDDSPRWDGVLPGPWSVEGWRAHKGVLLSTIDRSPSGAPVANRAFAVGSVAFSALVAWNALELAEVVDLGDLRADARELVDAIDARWDDELRTWIDDGPTATSSGRVRTLEALLPLLVIDRPAARTQLVDATALGAPYGPAGVHRAEPTRMAGSYWRGPAWPQLSYLSWRAVKWAGDGLTLASLQNSLVSGARRSGFAEYWDADSSAGLGAVPQSWSTLAVVVASDR